MSKQQKVIDLTQPNVGILKFKYIVDDLYGIDKTFRDPVWKDIFVNHLEVVVIDTPAFQRLGGLRQLGPTNLVYRGALHTRFDHSLGVLYWTQELLDRIDRNPHKEGRLEDLYIPKNEPDLLSKVFTRSELTKDEAARKETYGEFFFLVVRLAALIHDLPNLPFSHTLDDEGNIFKSQWKNQSRINRIFAKSAPLYRDVRSYLSQLRDSGEPKGAVKDADLDSLCNSILGGALKINSMIEKIADRTSTEEGIDRFISSNYPAGIDSPLTLGDDAIRVAAYVIGNTVCADLIDYTSRDFYFCGVDEKVDTRFTRYAIISAVKDDTDPDNKKPVVAYRVCKPTTRELKLDVLTGITNMMHKRFILRQFVHFHHTKISFSAMISEAVNFYVHSAKSEVDDKGNVVEPKEKLEQEMLDSLCGDDALVDRLYTKSKDTVVETRYILERYLLRKPYKKITEAWRDRTYTSLSASPRLEVLETLRQKPQLRMEAEKKMSEWAGFLYEKCGGAANGSGNARSKVLLYIPPEPKKLYKELYTYIQYYYDSQAKVRRLDMIEKADWERIPTLSPIIGTFCENLKKNYESLWEVVILMTPDYFPFPVDFEAGMVRVFNLVTHPRAQDIELDECRIDEIDAHKLQVAVSQLSSKPTGSSENVDWYRDFPSPDQVVAKGQ